MLRPRPADEHSGVSYPVCPSVCGVGRLVRLLVCVSLSLSLSLPISLSYCGSAPPTNTQVPPAFSICLSVFCVRYLSLTRTLSLARAVSLFLTIFLSLFLFFRSLKLARFAVSVADQTVPDLPNDVAF